MTDQKKTTDEVKAVISKDKKKVEATPEILRRAERIQQTRGSLKRDSMVSVGPLKIDFAYLGLDPAKDRTRFVHVEESGRLEKYMRLGYEFVHDPITGDPVVKEVRVGQEKRKSYLLRTDESLYQQGQKEKSARVKEGLATMNKADKNFYVSESNLKTK